MRGPSGPALLVLAASACGPAGEDAAATNSGRATVPEAVERATMPDSSGRAGAGTGRPGAESRGAATPEGESTLPPMVVTGSATDTIVLRSEGPTLQFLPDRISATAGTLVLLRYENGGDLPHNFALFRSDEAIDRLVLEAYEAQATGYIPVSAGREVIAYSRLLSPGETAEMEFAVPPPGRYPYICLFPGHAQMMVGTLTSRD